MNLSQSLCSRFSFFQPGVNLIFQLLQVTLTSVAIALESENNSYTCKSFIKLTPAFIKFVYLVWKGHNSASQRLWLRYNSNISPMLWTPRDTLSIANCTSSILDSSMSSFVLSSNVMSTADLLILLKGRKTTIHHLIIYRVTKSQTICKSNSAKPFFCPFFNKNYIDSGRQFNLLLSIYKITKAIASNHEDKGYIFLSSKEHQDGCSFVSKGFH